MDPKQDQLIYALLNSKTKAEASRMSGISHATMYRMLADPQFMAAYRAALRDGFHDALALLARNAVKAVQTLVDEMGPERTESFSVIAAATRVLDRAFKAQDSIAAEEEMAKIRATLELLEAGQRRPPDPVAEAKPPEVPKMTVQDQAEACRLRVAWMGEIGSDPLDIEHSLRYNRPQSVAEEAELLDVVRKLLEQERIWASPPETGGVLGE